MFSVFISAKSLENICIQEMCKSDQEKSEWFLLLTKQNVIYLDKNIYNEWEYGDPLFVFSESYQVEFKPANADYNSIVSTRPDSLLDEPQGAFLLDIDKETADTLQNKYGIVCQSTNDLDRCPLLEPACMFSLTASEKDHSWKELFNNENKIPSNSIIIVDRYLFGFEKVHRSGYYDGLTNIKEILRSVLPESLSCSYQVLILFDSNQSTSDNYYNFDDLANNLDDFKKSLCKPYEINIEIFSVSKGCFNYDETHNRKIISNYFICSAEHLIKAFHKDGSAI